MKAQGPRGERETIITFNEDDDMAWIWTASDTVYRRLLKRLGRECLAEDGERHAKFVFPKKTLILPRKRTPKASDPTLTLAKQRYMAGVRRGIRPEKIKNGI